MLFSTMRTNFFMGAEESLDKVFLDPSSIDLVNKGLETLSTGDVPAAKAIIVNAQNNKIRSIPSDFKALTHLNLSNNGIGDKIGVIAKQLVDLPKLSHIDLSSNELSFLPPSLSSSTKFTELSLANNSITSVELENSKSDILNLSQNLLTDFPKLPKSGININLAGNNIKEITRSENNIQKLNISLNGLELISPKISFSALLSLDISRNNIISLPDFSSLSPNLQNLDFGHNKVVEFPKVPKTLIILNFRHNQIRTIPSLIEFSTLTSLEISYNMIEALPSLPKSLVTLNAIHNIIYEVAPSELPNLNKVSMQYNQLEEIPPFRSNNVTEYNVAYNRIIELSLEYINSNIEALDISNNALYELPEDIFSLKSMKVFRLQNNILTSIPNDICSSNIHELNVSMNQLKSLPPNLPQSLKILRCSFCSLQSLPESLKNLTKLRELTATNNNLSSLSYIPSLKTCRMSKNAFKSVPVFPETIETIDFSCNMIQSIEKRPYHELYDVDFSFNDIKKIEKYDWPSLRYFRLAHNPIVGKHSFANYQHLHTLTIEGTKIECIKPYPLKMHQCKMNNFEQLRSQSFNYIDNMENVCIAEMKGLRKSMEDATVSRHEGDIYMFGVFDGHGGDYSSSYCAYHFSQSLKFIEEYNCKTIFKLFVLKHKNLIKAKPNDGTTACVLYKKDDIAIVGNVGDSRAVIIKEDGAIAFQTNDHSISMRKEFARIRNEKGIIINNRVAGHVGLTRSFGNYGAAGISAKPDISKIKLKSDDKWIIVGCDGLFGFMSNEDIQRMSQRATDAKSFAYDLRNTAYAQNGRDNISVIVVKLI